MDLSLWMRRNGYARLVRFVARRRGFNPGLHPSDEERQEIDVFTPLIEKDLETFSRGLPRFRKFVRHPIGKHFVVGPVREPIVRFCEENGLVFVSEREIVDFPLERLREIYRDKPFDRAGWLWQQFLKFNLNKVSEAKHCLLMDSDTLFVQPVAFQREGRWILDYTDGYQEEYDYILRRLLGERPLQPFSFVTHYMIVSQAHLQAMKESLADRFDMPWDEAILRNIDFDAFTSFSEYELYANFVLQNFPSEYRTGYWFNTSLSLSDMEKVLKDEAWLAERWKSVSFHYYNRNRAGSLNYPGRIRKRVAASATTAEQGIQPH